MDEDRLYQAIGQRIRKLRQSQPGGVVTQAHLAEMVGLERTSITNIERGNQKVSLHVLYRICAALNTPVTDTIPALSEIQQDAPPMEELPFASQTVEATPMVKQALLAVLGRSS